MKRNKYKCVAYIIWTYEQAKKVVIRWEITVARAVVSAA